MSGRRRIEFSPRLERFLIAAAVLALFAGASIVMSFFVVPEQNRDVVMQLVGGVNTLAGLVIGFYFSPRAERALPPDPPAPAGELPRPTFGSEQP